MPPSPLRLRRAAAAFARIGRRARSRGRSWVGLGLLTFAAARGEPADFRLVLDPGNHDRIRSPVSFTTLAPDFLRGASYVTAALLDAGGRPTGELIQAVIAEDQVTLYWVEPTLKAGVPAHRTVHLAAGRAPARGDVTEAFHFANGPGWRELRYGDQPIWRRNFAFDPAQRDDSAKPWLQIAGWHDDGFITKGPGGFYSSQRGLFLGWGRTEFEARTYDFWSCAAVSQRQTGFLPGLELAGAVVGRDAAVTDWLLPDGRIVLRDTREFTAWHTGAAELVLDSVVTLTATQGRVGLNGDAHHSGLQLRVANEVRDRAVETYFIRSPGSRYLAPDIWDRTEWVTMVFRIGSHTYAITDMSHPDNPRPTRFATRDYGRIGTTFEGALAPGQPRILRNRFLIEETAAGALNVATQSARFLDFVDPVKISIE